jgi:hypothetical protein
MKLFLMLLLVLTETACTDTTTVYLCDSPGGKKYHYSDHCRGLSNCSHRLIKTTVDEAKKRGKTVCLWEKNAHP